MDSARREKSKWFKGRIDTQQGQSVCIQHPFLISCMWPQQNHDSNPTVVSKPSYPSYGVNYSVSGIDRFYLYK
jgi:hypothetical protein